MYIRDPSGSLVEINWPNVTTVDRNLLPQFVRLAELFDQSSESGEASLFLDRPYLQIGKESRAVSAGLADAPPLSVALNEAHDTRQDNE